MRIRNAIKMYLLFLILSSCFLSKKKTTKQVLNVEHSGVFLGDTTLELWNKKCEYVIDSISQLCKLPDSISINSAIQYPKPGDTIKNRDEILIFLYVDNKQRVDTFYYQVNLSCGATDVIHFITICKDGSSDSWELPSLKKYPNNLVKLFDRHGNLVFEEVGYYTGFCGETNTKYGLSIANKDGYLPEGNYFYIID